MADRTVLAIQSHVVHGYVGNKAATFPLQLRGWDVDALNAVQFSNHTGYGAFKGYRLDGQQIEEIYAGIQTQKFTYDALLTGYLPSASAVYAVSGVGADLRARNTNSVWLLDPVMGDEGKLYVKEDVVPAYKSILQKKGSVTIITPNHFEVELLTGIKLHSSEDVRHALHVFHTEYGVPHVVISSMPHPTDPKKLLTVGSSANNSDPFVIEQQKLDTYFTGTGDLFAALLLDNYTKLGPERLADATTITIAVLRKVLYATWKYSREHHNGTVRIADPSMKFHELRLIQSASELVSQDTGDVKWVPYQ